MGKNRHDDDVLGTENLCVGENCVCDVVRAIDDAQDNILDNSCDVSCGKAVRNLLAPVSRNNLDTVPFILYGKDLKPFKGYGADIEMTNQGPVFDCTESFIFRVNEVGDDCCATLELLTFDDEQPDEHGDVDGAHCADDPCEQIDGRKVNHINRTGICITVDLKCFCAITCLPAVSVF